MDAIQQQIDAGAKAPRVTPADLEAEIVSEHYFTARDGFTGARYNAEPRYTMGVDRGPPQLGLLTFCVLVLRNGFTVTGESACVSAANFDAEIGRKVARDNALQKLWPLLGFRLADRLAAPPLMQFSGTPLSEQELAELVRQPGQVIEAPGAARSTDCPHAAPFRYCDGCKADPCPIGLDQR